MTLEAQLPLFWKICLLYAATWRLPAVTSATTAIADHTKCLRNDCHNTSCCKSKCPGGTLPQQQAVSQRRTLLLLVTGFGLMLSLKLAWPCSQWMLAPLWVMVLLTTFGLQGCRQGNDRVAYIVLPVVGIFACFPDFCGGTCVSSQTQDAVALALCLF